MKFNRHHQQLLQEANNTHLRVVQVVTGLYVIRCVLGETVLQGDRAIQYGVMTQILVKKYPHESEDDCRLIAFHPLLDNFKNPFFNNPGLVDMTLKDLMLATG